MSVYEFGPFHLDVDRLLLMRSGEPVALGPKVVETLLALVEHPGEVQTKRALLDRIWPDGFVDEMNLAQNVYVLRRAFRHHGLRDPVDTVPRRGYRFTAPVRKLAAAVPDGPVYVVPEPPATTPGAPRLGHALSRRFAAAAAGAAVVTASAALFFGFTHRAEAPRTRSGNAAQSYQIGRYYWNLRTRDGVRKSLTYFERVVDGDPQDARGYAALADANVAMGDYCYGTHQPAVYFARARAYADKALALDPNSAEARAALGFLALDRGDVRVAQAELRRAIALDPSYAPAHEWYAIERLGRGHVAEGLRHLQIAADLEPLSTTTIAWLASAAYASGRFSDAIVYSRQALELAPQRADALATLGEAYAAQGDTARAIETFERYGALGAYYRAEAAALLARAYALGNRMPEAKRQLAYARAREGEVYPGFLAAAAAAIGVDKGVLDALRRSRGHRMGTENAVRFYALRRDAQPRRLAQKSDFGRLVARGSVN